MSLDPFLLSILVDPEDKEPLWYFADEATLYNPRSRRRYAVRDGIPVLLVGESEELDETEATRSGGARIGGRRHRRAAPGARGPR